MTRRRWWIYAFTCAVALAVNLVGVVLRYTPWIGVSLVGVQLAVTAWVMHTELAGKR